MIVIDTPRALSRAERRGRLRRFRRTAHLGSTLRGPEGTAELLQFARSIGLRDAWLQSAGTPTEHFDVFDSRIPAALEAGAHQVTPREFVALVVKPKRAA